MKRYNLTIIGQYDQKINYYNKSFNMACHLLRIYTNDGYHVIVSEVKK